ncbi:hypothetical protein KKA47_03015 [bacterium]|nr:hypothetical protein [bacterium]
MGDCWNISPVALASDPYQLWDLTEDDMVCNVHGISFFVSGASSQTEVQILTNALDIFPKSFLKHFISGMTFVIIPREEYEGLSSNLARGYSSNLGIKTKGKTWYIRADLFETDRKNNLTHRIWYVLAARMADALDGMESFDRGRFQASFNRYLTKSIDDSLATPWVPMDFFMPGIDMKYQAYFDKLSEVQRFDKETLRRLFTEVCEEKNNQRRSDLHRSVLLTGRIQPWRLDRYYQQFTEAGLSWRFDSMNTINIILQNADSRERPESSHRVNLHYTNLWLNEKLNNVIQKLIPGLSPNVLWAPGVIASYENRVTNADKCAAFLVGSLLDVGAKTYWGNIGLHSYVGYPFVKQFADDKGENYNDTTRQGPEWEIGLNYRALNDSFFIGSVYSVSFFAPEQFFLGFMMRWEEW